MAQSALQSEPTAYVSPADYLRLERKADSKHEYFQGEIRAMAGAGYAHHLICANLTGELYTKLRGKGRSVVGSDQRLQIMSGSAFVYPDLTVVCGKPELARYAAQPHAGGGNCEHGLARIIRIL